MLLLLAQLALVDTTELSFAARAANVPPTVMYAVAYVETRNGQKRNNYRGTHGEIGRMQILPSRGWRWTHCQGRHIYEYYHNIMCGASILRWLYDSTGSWAEAIRRYNGAGPESWRYQQNVLIVLGRLHLDFVKNPK